MPTEAFRSQVAEGAATRRAPGAGWFVALAVIAFVIAGGARSATASNTQEDRLRWIEPGSDIVVPTYFESANEFGRVGFLNTAGPVRTKGHPFFEPQGRNGRA